MRDITIGVTMLCLIVIAFVAVAKLRHNRIEYAHEVVLLQQEVQARQVMLDDLHRIVPLLEMKVGIVETDSMTARELLWHIEEIAKTTECMVVHK